ncbi:MAG: hypothetical protein ACXV3F_07085 [Frankiaceae bacterium]
MRTPDTAGVAATGEIAAQPGGRRAAARLSVQPVAFVLLPRVGARTGPALEGPPP